MKTSKATIVSCAALFGALGVAPAQAGDWSINAVTTSELNISENRALRDKSLGVSFAHIGDTAIDFDYAMPDGSFNISTDLKSFRFFGPAKEDGKNNFLPHIGFNLTKTSRLDTVALTADYRIASVTLQDIIESGDELAEPDFIPVDTVRHTTSAGAKWTRKLDQNATLTLNNVATLTTYNSEVGTDNTLVNSTLAWERRLSARHTANITGGVSWLSLDDGPNTNRLVYSIDTTLTTRLTKNLTSSIGAGLNYTDTSRDGRDPDGQFTNDFMFSLDYVMKNTKLAFDVNYNLAQGVLGDFDQQLATTASITHTINDRSSVTGTANLVLFEDEAGGDLGSSYTFSLSPTYSLALTDEWTMKTGYRFVRRSASFAANSNTVFVSMTRDFTVLP
jgi:hypothetical protein